MSSKSMKRKLGQNTAEYMLLLLLIGGGSIVAFKIFGKGIVNRFASVTNIITGKQKIEATGITSDEHKNATIDFSTFEDGGNKK